MSELLVRKYGAKETAKALLKAYNIDLNKLSDLETERIFVMGQMLGWSENFKKALPPPPENALPVFDYGNFEPIGHLKEFIDICFNGYWRWSENVGSLRVVNHFASRVMYDLVNRNRSGKYPAAYGIVCGAASTGKTATAALYALTMFFIYRKQLTCKLVSTSATSAEDRIFGALVNLYENSYYGKNPSIPGDGRFHIIQGSDRRILFLKVGEMIDMKGEKKEKMIKSFLTGIQLVPVQKGSEGQGAVRRLAGIKAPMKLLIVDESTDTDASVFSESMLLNWSVAPLFSQVAFLLNPRHDARRSVAYIEPAKGWKDPEYSPDSPGWATKKDGWATQLSGEDTPNRLWRAGNDPERKNGPVAPFPFLISQTDIDSAERRCGGKGSPAYNTMVTGFLCEESANNTIITLRTLEESGAMEKAHWIGDGTYALLGVDPAFGGDKFCITAGYIGLGLDKDGQQKVFLEIDKVVYAPFVPQTQGSAEAGQVRFFQELCSEYGVGAESVACDSTGSSGVFMVAAEMAMGGKMFHRVSFAACASERVAGPGETKTSAEKFNDSKSEIVYSIRDYLPYIRNLTNDQCIDQLVARQFHVKGKNKICVEMKSDFVKRIGIGSPDESDSLAILIDIARSCGLGTSRLSHPLATQSRLGRDSRIVIKARYAQGFMSDEPRAGVARYGVAS